MNCGWRSHVAGLLVGEGHAVIDLIHRVKLFLVEIKPKLDGGAEIFIARLNIEDLDHLKADLHRAIGVFAIEGGIIDILGFEFGGGGIGDIAFLHLVDGGETVFEDVVGAIAGEGG